MMETWAASRRARDPLWRHQVISGVRTPGSFFSFMGALLLAYQPLKSLAGLNTTLQEGLAAADRIFGLLDTEPDIREMHGAKPIAVTRGEIRFEDVHFGYANGAVALDSLSLTVPAARRWRWSAPRAPASRPSST